MKAQEIAAADYPLHRLRLPGLEHGTPVPAGLKGAKHNDPADLNITPASVTAYLTTPCGSALMPTGLTS